MKPSKLVVTGLSLALLFIAAWVMWSIFGVELAHWTIGERGIEKAGQWGDSFGAFNALISSFGFCAVALTLWSQSKALHDQQEAIASQKAQLKRQQDDQHKQRFESSFFELLKLLRECRDQFECLDHNNNKLKGLDAFRFVVLDISRIAKTSEISESMLSRIYGEVFHPRIEIRISPYFRVIYRILDRIREDSILSCEDKIEYSKLLRGQLSSPELILIGMNSRLEVSKDLSDLLSEFRLLKYMPNSEFRNELQRFLPLTAFQGRGS